MATKTRCLRKWIAYCFSFLCVFAFCVPQAAHAAADNVEITIDLEQSFTVEATDAQIDQKIGYTLTAENSDTPLPAGGANGKYTFVVDGTNKATLRLEYTHAGEYIYTLKPEITGAKKGYTYDKEIYTLKVYMLNTASGLQPEVIFQRSDNNKVAAATYKHSYKPEAADRSLMVDPPVEKTITGTPKETAEFTFKLSAKDSKNPMPEGSKSGVKTVIVKGAGSTEFGTWEYTAAGVYQYEVTEVNNGTKGYTYDTGVYSISDTVKDVDGKLVLERKITDAGGKTADKCAFTNVYSDGAAPTPTPTAAPTPTASPTTAPTATKSSGGSSGTVSGPKTGDEYDNTLFIVLLCIAAAAAAGAVIWIVWTKKRKGKDEK